MGPVVDEDEPTSEVCAQCEDDLIMTEDVFVIRVMRPVIVAGHPQLRDLLDEEGDFFYENYFLHFKCWEEIVEDFKEEIEDAPPVPDEFPLLRCDCCGSAIREHEPVLVATMGELIRSKRSPSNTGQGLELVPSGAPDVYCTWCLSMINEHYLTFWEDGVTIDGECLECQHVRCWRGFDCACTCHDEGEG